MSIKVKIGKGRTPGKPCIATLGLLTAELTDDLLHEPLYEIAKKLAEQFEIKNGEVELHSINFIYKHT